VPHAAHFLERLDRVTRAQTEFALELYRDHEAVKYVLARVHLPEKAERVALAIDDPREGPFVVVSREGRFITCLGAGMKHDLHVVPRGQTDALLAKLADQRARKEVAQRELRPDEEEEELFQRIVTRGSRFAREDFVALSAFESLLGESPYIAMLEMAVEALRLRAPMAHGANKVVIKGSSKPMFEKLDRIEWSVAHLMMLSGAAERRNLDEILDTTKNTTGTPTYSCSAQGGTTFFLRAAWAAARLGKGVLPVYKRSLAETDDWQQQLDAALGLAAIGMRHASTLPEVKRILTSHPFIGDDHPDAATAQPIDRSRGAICALLNDTLEHAEERTATALAIGRDYAVICGQNLPDGHPLKFEKPEQVGDDLARTGVLSLDGAITDARLQHVMIIALPLAARADAENFYFPREVVRAWFGQWTPEESLERLKRFAEKKKEPTVNTQPKPGRNDPCFCGSGKKYKKCHGGPQAAPG
jgi:hypothetical protein